MIDMLINMFYCVIGVIIGGGIIRQRKISDLYAIIEMKDEFIKCLKADVELGNKKIEELSEICRKEYHIKTNWNNSVEQSIKDSLANHYKNMTPFTTADGTLIKGGDTYHAVGFSNPEMTIVCGIEETIYGQGPSWHNEPERCFYDKDNAIAYSNRFKKSATFKE